MSTTLNLIELRTGGTGDLVAVDAIMRSAFDPRYGEAWTRGQCLGILAMPGVWLTLATIDGATCGFALARATGDEAELLLIATMPAVRRRGVGGALLRAVVAESKSRMVKSLYLEMRAGNDAAALYRAAGFIKVGERRSYYRGSDGHQFDALTFQLEIDRQT